MGRFKIWLLALLIFFASSAALQAQEPITATADAQLQPEMPRRLLFTLEAASSEGDITSARLFFRPTGSTVRTSEPIQFDPASSVDLSHEWQMQQNGIPPGTHVEYHWSLTDSASNTFETPRQTALALDPRFDWQTMEEERLAIHWYDGGQEWGRQMFETGQRALAQLEEELGTEVERQVRLVAYRSGEDFRGAFPPQQNWIGGQAFPSLGVTVQIIGAGDESWMETVLFHELSHLVFHQALEGSLASAPAWLDEGLAMYNEPDSRDSERRVREAAEANMLLPFSHLQGNFGADGQVVGIAYAQSEMMVTYLIDDCGRDGFRTFIQNMVDNMTVDRALEAACGYDSQTLYNNWRQTLPNAPAPAGESEQVAEPATTRAPAPVSTRPVMQMRLAFIAGGFCFIGLLMIAILVVLIRLLRPSRGAT
jgi:hypothetical protein